MLTPEFSPYLVHNTGRWIFISPHLDDVVLSCGGIIPLLAKQVKVEVWTIFCGAPWFGPYSSLANWFHSVSGGQKGKKLFKIRKAEDVEALTQLSLTGYRHFQWKDAIYRRTLLGTPLYTDCRQSRWHRNDEILISAIRRRLRTSTTSSDLLICPLGIGSHVDHLLVNKACQQLMSRHRLWYAEIPYSQRYPTEFESATRDAEQLTASISEDDTESWIRSTLKYRTQIKMLEEVTGDITQFIRVVAQDSNFMSLYAKH
jgi:LmbE family N-acetylglucosaminyl deacetylase